MIGTKIQQYKVHKKIGQGGMGVVYKAFDTMLQRTVALKFLPETFTANDTNEARFLREARAASGINHPNVCTVYDLKENQGKQFIVMEYIEGETFKELVNSGRRLSIDKVAECMIQVAKALKAAHDNGVIHRDIKSENIMLTSSGQIKVMDFGLARMKGASQLTRTASTAGTVAYMSPEQLDGRKIDSRSDIFSFGVVFYELLTGHLPFQGEHPSSMINSILNHDPEPLEKYIKHIPGEIKQIIERTLQKEADKRYENICRVLDDLSQAQKSGQFLESATAANCLTASNWKKLKINRGIVLFFFIVCSIITGIWVFKQFKLKSETPLQIIPITRGGGKAERSQFSPDGTKIVYDYLKSDKDNSDIYIQQLGTNQVFQLTSTPESDISPAWSPDGKFIAFCRVSADPAVQGIYLISSLGGIEKKLNSKSCQYLCWAPDGHLLAFSDYETGAVFLLDVDSREERQLTFPKVSNASFWVDRSASFSPDGKYLAFARCESFATCAIYVISTAGGEPKQITFDNDQIFGLTWTSTGNRIIYDSNRAVGRKLWSIKPNGKGLRLISASGRRSFYPAVSADGTSLLFTEQHEGEFDIGRIKILAKDLVAPQEIIAFEGHDCWPDISPDGKTLTFVSTRTGRSEVWTCDCSGDSLQQITYLENYTGRPRWSPDGKHITFDSRPAGNSDIFIISADGGVPRQLTTDSLDQILPNWSRDGHWIYYCSRYQEDHQIYRVSSDGGPPQQITRNGGLLAFEGFGGFLFLQKSGQPEIWRCQLDGLQEMIVFEESPDYRWWCLDDDGIYYFTRSAEKNIRHFNFFSFKTLSTNVVATIKDVNNISGPVLSPDGQYVYFHYIAEKLQADIYLVDNFE